MIKKIGIDKFEEWDRAVKKIDNYDVFYLCDFLKAFSLQEKGEPLLFIYSDDEDYAVNAVFCRDIAQDEKLENQLEEGKYYDLITPYGYGGWIGSISNYEKLLKSWNTYCIKKGYICEFVRFELFTDYHKFFDGNVETRSHNVIRSLDMSIDEIWKDFKQKVRKNVKRANLYNLEIIRDSDGKYLDDFLRIYNSTMDRKNAENKFYFKKDFYMILNKMKDNIMYFHVVFHDEKSGDNKIISTELVIFGTQNCYSFLGGTDEDYFAMRPNDFLKFEIIKWAIEKGLKNFVLGGGYGTDDGIFQYKKNLSPNGMRNFYIGKKIFNYHLYEKFVELRSEDNPECVNSNYFPQYRA